MSSIRRKPVPIGSPDSVPNPLRAVRQKPVASLGQYQQAAQDEDDFSDPDSREEHAEARHLGPRDQHQYNRVSSAGEIDFTDIPRAVSPPSTVSPLSPNNEWNQPATLPSQLASYPSNASENTSVVEYSHHPPKSWPTGSRHRMWAPIWLSRLVLLLFAALFAAMMVATALLDYFSIVNDGVSTQSEANHYGWKYGPTALLVIVGALWKQVDRHNKILMPWQELRTGPSTVHKTLLLDYVSPLLPTSLWMAAKNRHWAVVMSTLGHLLILGTTVFSTGLLILEPTKLTKKSDDFILRSEFQMKGDPGDAFELLLVGPAAAQVYYGIHFQGLRYPAGTSENILVPELQPPQDTPNSINYTLTTEGIQLDIDCEILPIKNGTSSSQPWKSILGSFFVADVNTTDCNITGVTLAAGPGHYYYHQKNATQNFQGQVGVYPCNIDWDFANNYVRSNDQEAFDLVYNASADQRLVLSVADLRFPPYNDSRAGPEYLYIEEVSVALCKPSYSLRQFDVQSSSIINGSAQAVVSSSTTSQGPKLLKGLSSGSITRSVMASTGKLNLGSGGEDYVLSEEVPTFFQLMQMKNGGSRMRAFLDPELLVDRAADVFKGVATQVLRQRTLQPTNRKVAGTYTYTEDRLKVKALSTGFMCAFFALLTALALGMAFVRPRAVVPHEPGSIASAAVVLAASPDFHDTLRHMEPSRRSEIRAKLEKFDFRSVVHPGEESAFSIEPVRRQESRTFYQPPDGDAGIVSWWRPVAGENWFLCVALGLSLLVIAALEIVQHFSDIHDGFISIGHSDSIVLATYIPAAIALGIASMFSALELMAAVFAPFDALKRGRVPADRSIHSNVVGKLLPKAFYLALKSRQFAVLVALLANFIGGFLTIVVSGLYSAVEVPRTNSVTVELTDIFNFDDVDLSLNDNQATAIDSLIEYFDLDYPQWTHGGLVFSHFEAPGVATHNASSQAPLTIEVPAIRPKMNCTEIPPEDRRITIVDDEQAKSGMGSFPGQSSFFQAVEGYMLIGFNTTMDPLKWCEKKPSNSSAQPFWMQYFLIPNDTSPAYVGKASLLLWDDQIVMGDGGIDTNPTTGTGLGASGLVAGQNGCPTFAVTFGSLRAADAQRVGNVTRWQLEHDLGTIVCYQNIEQVTANVTWNLPSFEIAESPLPRADESSKKALKTRGGSERFPFAINSWLQGLSDSVSNRSLPGPDGAPSINNDIDEFIKALVNGKNGQPLEDLLGSANTDNLAKDTSDLYQTYMAQAISLNMRDNSTEDDSKLYSYAGNLTTTGTYRLRQNKGPKIALQAMVAVMVACGIAMRLLLQVHEVLPHNPCSIAGTATMLAGGEMATRRFIPSGAEWRTGKELKQAGVFENHVYSLKWWEAAGGNVPSSQRYGVDVHLEPR